MPMAWSTAATSAATGRASGKFATAPRPSAISFCACLPEHRAVLAVQQRHRAGRLRGAGRREQGGLVGREVRVGQEDLDARVPASGEGGDLAFWQRGGVHEDRVEKPVDRGLRQRRRPSPG